MVYIILVAGFVEKYIMEIAVVVLAILYALKIISVKKPKGRLSK